VRIITAAAHAPPGTEDVMIRVPASQQRPKVLYIEDDPASRMLVRSLLEGHGYQVVESGCGLDGIEAALRERPHLMLLDLRLPDVDGETVAAILRSFPKLAAAPIVGITAHDEPGQRDRTLVAGCDGWLTKPIDPERFPGQIAEFLAGKRESPGPGEEAHLRELNQRLVCHLLVQLDESRRHSQQADQRARSLEAVHDALHDLTSTLGLTPLLEQMLPGLAAPLGASEVLVELSETPGTRLRGLNPAIRSAGAEVTPVIELKFPLVVKGRALGFIVARYGPGAELAPEDEHLFKIVANHVAIAVENARCLEAERAARAQTEQARRRAAFMARAGEILAYSLDYDRTLALLGDLAVPDLGEVCLVDLLEPDGQAVRLSVVAIADASKAHLAPALRSYGPRAVGDNHPAAQVIRTGEPRIVPEIGDELLRAFARDGEHFQVLQKLAPASGMIVPIKTQARVLGAISVLSLDPGRRYGPADLDFAQDLTSRAALALDNAALCRELKASDDHKNRFLAVLAHELRTPLAPILSTAEVLRHYEEGIPAVTRARQIIEQQVHHQARILDDLLDLARFSQGKMEVQHFPVDLRTAVNTAVVMARSAIEGRGHRLSVSLPDEPLIVLGDATRLEQVIVNLLTNAARYTPPGGDITVAGERQRDVAAIRVRDTGAGIPKEMLGSIFEMFAQIEHADRPVGVGIGLALVRRLVERHGGTVEALSEGSGRGSEFVVRLPIAGGLVSEAPAAPPPLVTPRRLLLVEDNADAAEALRLVLELEGHTVDVAHTGLRGVELAITQRPEAALVDVGLPGMDGYEVAQRIRAALGRDIVLVAITGHGQPEDRRLAREAGFDVHVLKPARVEDIARVLALCAGPEADSRSASEEIPG
jgi:signal transduction histidine kinase/DNA-binding response OmpR family regulator